MAGKNSTLSIVIRTVDKATAGIQAVNKKIDEITRPTRDFGKALGELGEKSGLHSVVDGFKGVGGAVEGLIGKIALIGGVASLAVHSVLGLVDEFDDLGDKSEKLGVTVDFLAAMRFAAERSGAAVDVLDQGLTAFSQNLGQLRGGSGKLLTSLQKWAPSLVPALLATKGTESAFRLFADAISKVTDNQKRLALVQKAFGNSDLAPLLARGSHGLSELQGEFAGTAGSLEEAAEAAGKTDDALKTLKAATAGVKAAIVTGLAPALEIVVTQLAEWFSAHREDIKEWSAQIGSKVPDAVEKVVTTIKGAVETVAGIVDGIGGLKVAALALVAIIVGPLISSIVSLGIAILATPVGWILAAVAAISLGAFELISHWDAVKGFFVDLWNTLRAKFGIALDIAAVVVVPFIAIPLEIIGHWEGISGFFHELWDDITGVFQRAWSIIDSIVGKVTGAVDAVTGAIGKAIDFINPFSSTDTPSPPTRAIAANSLASGIGGAASITRIKVDFANTPRGTKVTAQPQGPATIDMTTGYQFGFGQ
jgi:phage-related minor tail protein